MKRRILIIYIMTVVAVTTACQPTPEKEIVANKADGGLQEKIESTAVSTAGNESAEAPKTDAEAEKRWVAKLQNGNVNINIDAEVVTPDADVYPVLSIIPIEANQEWVNRSLEILFQGVTPYQNMGITKQNAEKRILNNKKVMNRIQAGNCPDGFTEDSYKLLYQENQVLTEIRETAPDESNIEMVPADIMLKESEKGLFLLRMIGKIDKPSYASLPIMNNSTTKINYINFSNYHNNAVIADVRTNEYTENVNINGVSISADEALKIAEETIADMEITGVELIDIGIANIFEVKPSIDVEYVASDKQAYEFSYARSYNGINVLDFSSAMIIEQKEEAIAPEHYSPVLYPEKLVVRVDDSGIVYFNWRNPTYSDGIISENAELLEFEKIKEIFSNHVFYHYFHNDSNVSMNIDINKIVLSYFIQPEIDNNNEYVTMPVWDFIGVQEVNGKHIDCPGVCFTFLTVNAIDGSVINRDIGY